MGRDALAKTGAGHVIIDMILGWGAVLLILGLCVLLAGAIFDHTEKRD